MDTNKRRGEPVALSKTHNFQDGLRTYPLMWILGTITLYIEREIGAKMFIKFL
jgi:hypothetical protein